MLILSAGVAAGGRADEIGTARLQVAGSSLTASPAVKMVPLDSPTLVETELVGYDPALGALPPSLRVLGNLSGPEVDGVLTLETVPNEPFRIPRFRIRGEYTLANVRLGQPGQPSRRQRPHRPRPDGDVGTGAGGAAAAGQHRRCSTP